MPIARFLLRFLLINVTAMFCLGGIRQVLLSLQDLYTGTSTFTAWLAGLGFGLALIVIGSLSVANMPTLFRIWGASHDDLDRAQLAIRERAAEHVAAAQHPRNS